ncbi:hypothetical protein EON65_37685 [archaeon]|nr:MAG: hypothetical protein EON65_37685 [archaeon]
MGNTQASQVGVNRNSIDGMPRFKPPREHKRFGCVTLKVHTINARNAEDQVSHVLTPKGALLYGSLFNPGVVLKVGVDAHVF